MADLTTSSASSLSPQCVQTLGETFKETVFPFPRRSFSICLFTKSPPHPGHFSNRFIFLSSLSNQSAVLGLAERMTRVYSKKPFTTLNKEMPKRLSFDNRFEALDIKL
jgi:hypothetical protein